jgi:hypothetical protein
MTSLRRQSRIMQAANAEASKVWPALTTEQAERAKDAAFAVMIALMQAGRDASVCRAQYMNHVAMIERAAGFGD